MVTKKIISDVVFKSLKAKFHIDEVALLKTVRFFQDETKSEDEPQMVPVKVTSEIHIFNCNIDC